MLVVLCPNALSVFDEDCIASLVCREGNICSLRDKGFYCLSHIVRSGCNELHVAGYWAQRCRLICTVEVHERFWLCRSHVNLQHTPRSPFLKRPRFESTKARTSERASISFGRIGRAMSRNPCGASISSRVESHRIRIRFPGANRVIVARWPVMTPLGRYLSFQGHIFTRAPCLKIPFGSSTHRRLTTLSCSGKIFVLSKMRFGSCREVSIARRTLHIRSSSSPRNRRAVSFRSCPRA
mmetsp:Transcript_7820/g.19164  ORF Transcript_7820/g.19164 Transcript_7820/m.19164 type:complete len:238 (-) Transcript_7820:988-1701(-)